MTFFNLFEKLGLIKFFRQVNCDFKELKKLPDQLSDLQNTVSSIQEFQQIQNSALLAIIRNDLYQCFKNNRDVCAWTDDDFGVQTKLHEAYKGLHGNGEEGIWWDKKKDWKIVSADELDDLIRESHKKKE
ncbi:MAG: hypothetical protein GX638_11835 [Crenarchaeota archaeon]|nr:hypothetical protein [Thermoproteota archaeon]